MTMAKKYSVNVHYDYVAHVEVVAENADDAIEKASEIAQNYPLRKLEYCDDIDACVTRVEDIC